MISFEDEIADYRKLLAEITGSAFEGIYKPYGNQLPYRWEFRTTNEPVRYVATIVLTAADIVSMNGAGEFEKREYLRSRFAHLFLEAPVA
jgi:hypothetical protein